nr:hypothetical protein 2 - mouse [Mus musculus]
MSMTTLALTTSTPATSPVTTSDENTSPLRDRFQAPRMTSGRWRGSRTFTTSSW